jgi:dihydrolipoamide dehydrogenase
MSKNFDVVVIGGGPGGYIAAIRAAQLGFNVACVDEWKNDKGGPAPGGTCTNVGCIPSKALLQSSENFEHAAHSFADHGITVQGLSMDVQKMLGRKNTVVKQNNEHPVPVQEEQGRLFPWTRFLREGRRWRL